MERFFNTSGPIVPAEHYHIPLMQRVDWESIQQLIGTNRYFVLHAPRQTGKTSTLLAIMQALNESGVHEAVYANIEVAQAARGDVTRGIPAVCSAICRSLRYYIGETGMTAWLNGPGALVPAEDRLTQLLEHWSIVTEKPCVLLLDEVDALVGDTLISLLRQLRTGYTQRPAGFPASIVLCGVRDIRDYRIRQSGGEIITGGSAFNVKAKSLRMGNFSHKETADLLLQHTDATGQIFEQGIFSEVWEDTQGQPWLVNALAHEMVWEERRARDRSVPIDIAMYLEARERLIRSRATHLDQLADKLREQRVRDVIAPLLGGERTQLQIPEDDLQYVEDLGLVVRKPQVRVSNRIYREIIPRELISVTQDTMVQDRQWYLTPDNRLDMSRLMPAFQQFFREHSQSWLERFAYREAGPQLLMQAFLQRIVNGGGRLSREYGLGRKRTDLFIQWPLDHEQGMYGPVQRVVIELKLLRGSLETVMAKALEQTAGYADTVGADEAHVVIFDQDSDVSWTDKIWERQEVWEQKTIFVWGC